MFFILSKVIPPFVFPPGGTLVLLFVAALLRKRRPRIATICGAIAAVSLYAFSTFAVANRLGATLEAGYPPVALNDVPAADAAVILGGSLHIPSPSRPCTELAESSDRLWMGVRLYRAGKAPLILLSGANILLMGEKGVSEAKAAQGLLREWGVPEQAMLIEEKSQNTHENAVFSKAILDARGLKRVLLVTSAFHMSRAVAIFHRAGVEVIPVPTDYLTGWQDRAFWMQLIPEPENLALSKIMLREWLGFWVYRVRGWA